MHAFCHASCVPAQAAPPSDVRRRRRRAGILALGALTAPSVLLALPVALAPPAAAEEAPASPTPPGGTTYCTITDPRLAELSGLVVVGDSMLAISDGGDQLSVLVLDDSCSVTDERTAPVDPYDPEDLGVSADGTIWVADTGDNRAERATVALHALRPEGGASLYRLTYPDGAHDSEALLMAPDGTPYLVTKEVLGASQVFRPAAELVDGGTVALEQVSTVNLTLTGTPGGPVGRAGQLLVTGGAVSGDGRLIALRTYTDAYLWPLTDSDVPAALAADPIRVALPDSPQGEAVSFGTDNRGLVIASEGSPTAVVIVSTDQPLAPVAEALVAPADAPAGVLDSDRSPITSGLIAAAVATVVIWIGGLLHRRRRD
jgi:hypothetical protein